MIKPTISLLTSAIFILFGLGVTPLANAADIFTDLGTLNRVFVVEVHNDGSAMIRFGDGAYGMLPAQGASIVDSYQAGGGVVGNLSVQDLGILDGTVTISPGMALDPLGQIVELSFPHIFEYYGGTINAYGQIVELSLGSPHIFLYSGSAMHDLGILDVATAPIPEPETYVMLLAGLGLLSFSAKRRKQSA